jgi:hypothetical protein
MGVGKAINAVKPWAADAGRSMGQRILKPTLSRMAEIGTKWGKAPIERAQGVTEALLKAKALNPSLEGVSALESQRGAVHDATTKLIENSTARVPTAPIVRAAENNVLRLRSQNIPPSDVAQAESAARGFKENPLITKNVRAQQTVQSPVLNPQGQPYTSQQTVVVGTKPMPTITIQKANALKQGTSSRLADKAYSGETQTPMTMAEKAINKAESALIRRAEPKTAPLLDRESRLIDMRDTLADAAFRTKKTNPLDLVTAVAMPSHTPWGLATLSQQPMIGRRIAQGAYNFGTAAPITLEEAVRAALLAELTGRTVAQR